MYLHHLDSVEKYNLPGKKNKETLGQFYYLALAGRLHLEGATFNDNKKYKKLVYFGTNLSLESFVLLLNRKIYLPGEAPISGS